MAKLSVAVAASALTITLTAATFAAETNPTIPDAGMTQGQVAVPGANQSDTASGERNQSAQIPEAGRDRQAGSAEQTPVLKRNNDAGSATSTGPAVPPAR